MNTKIISALLALALASMACGINIPKPPKPGPDVTDKIEVKTPDAEDVSLHLSFGAGGMKIASGAEQLVEGSATYNYPAFKPVVNEDNANVEIKMSESSFDKFPNPGDLKNEWDLKLGDTPMDLTIDSGAYTGNFEFGGLALNSLTIKDGAADVSLSFSEANTAEMSTFRYDTGASNIKMQGLANANFSLFDFSAGAGDYTLDFSGELQRDATIKIEGGLSNIHLIIPDDVNAIVTVDSGVSNITVGSNWTQSGDTYKQKAEGYTLTFSIEIGAGNLTLTK
jgi:hypothetical protein